MIPSSNASSAGVSPGAAEDSDQTGESARGMPGAFQDAPGTFQEQALLGIEQLGLARAHPEQAGIEAFHVLERARCAHVAR